MNMEKEHIPKQEEQEFLLTKEDRSFLERGVRQLYAKLNGLPSNELPQSILMIDIGARPLVYAIRPVIKTIYKQKDLREPVITFITKSDQMPSPIASRIIGRVELAIGTNQDWRKVITDNAHTEHEAEKDIQLISHNLELIDKVEKNIRNRHNKAKPTQFLVVDDWGSGGTTLAFADCLIALHQHELGLDKASIDGTRSFFIFGSSGEFPYDFPWNVEVKRNMWVGGYYEHSGGFSWRGISKLKKVGLTQTTEPPYHVRSDERDTKKMRALRSEIEEIASEQVAALENDGQDADGHV